MKVLDFAQQAHQVLSTMQERVQTGFLVLVLLTSLNLALTFLLFLKVQDRK